MAKNIKFSYLYRDGSNYKNYGFVIFATNIDLADLEIIIRAKLIDGTWFYANEWKLPDLFTINYNPSTDPTWHEFESIEYTNESAKEWSNAERCHAEALEAYVRRPFRSPFEDLRATAIPQQ